MYNWNTYAKHEMIDQFAAKKFKVSHYLSANVLLVMTKEDFTSLLEEAWRSCEKENMYYWCCEKRKSNECKDYAAIAFINSLYYLKKFNDHNHVPQAVVPKLQEEIYPYISSQNGLQVRIKYVKRADMPLQLTKLDDIDIPNLLSSTLSGEDFLVLFQDLIKFAEENNILLRPTTILTDFELAAINAS
ncbi:38640_t:CDS:2, partial [Gigaspora margarita]